MKILEVKDKKDLKRFIDFQYTLYKGCKYFVPPLRDDTFNTLNREKNPAFKYSDVMIWIVEENKKVLGRIVGIINRKEIEIWKKNIGRFGWVDFVDDIRVSTLLFSTYENWLKKNGIFESHGPMGFTDLDPEGMLIEGFEELGTLPMIYNYEYYPKHLEKLGYFKDIDWVEFEVKVPSKIPEKVLRVNNIVQEKLKVSILDIKKARELKKYAMKIFEILNESYSSLYGFVPLEKEQMESYTEQYFGFINPDYVKIVVDKEKNPIGFGIAMPSLSEALQKSKGKIFPFGFIHLLWALKFPKKIDLYLVAVKKEYMGSGLNALLITEITKSCIKNGIVSAETSGELENNLRVQSFWKYFEHRQHKRRRCFYKKLR